MKIAFPLLALLVVLSGCSGQARSVSHSGATRPPASAAPAGTTTSPASRMGTLIAIAEDAATNEDPRLLRLVRLDGTEVAHISLPQSSQVAGVGGGMATFVVDGELRALRPSGAVETLGRLDGYAGGPVTLSPDGRHWMWSAYTSTGSTVTSRILMGSRGATGRMVAQQTATAEPRVLMPYRWTAAGAMYQSSAMGLGGYILFGPGATGSSWRFDPDTGAVTDLLGASCPIADLASDGKMACLQNARGSSTLEVLWPTGHVVEVALPRPAFTQSGAVSFNPAAGSTTVVIGGATAAGPGQEQYEMDLFDYWSRSLRRLGAAGLRPADGPWAWLPNGSLVAYRPARALGGAPGIYLVAADGSARKVFPSGTPVGVIAA
jgi:hypothetical protein